MPGANAWFSTVVATAVLWHALVGCCAHHAHAVEVAAGDAPATAQATQPHHGRSHGHHHDHGPAGHHHDHAPPTEHNDQQPPHDDDCGEGDCSSLLTAFLKAPRDVALNPLMVPPPRMHPVAACQHGCERRSFDVPLIPAAAGSRLHCALSVWLI